MCNRSPNLREPAKQTPSFRRHPIGHILYGAPLSLYSGKARAYLDWRGVDYEEQLSTPDIYRDVIVPNVGRPVIPVVQTDDGAILQDTTLIIDHFERGSAGPSIYPDTPKQGLAARLLEVFGDEWLVIPAMHYRWHYNEDWVYGQFGSVALPDGTAEEQHAAGKERGAAFKGFCPMLGITEATIPAIETSYEALLHDLDAHFAAHDFLFGSRPSIGDYGLIGPLYAHLYRDPKSGELMDRIAPRVAAWVNRMVHVEHPQSGEFLADDAIPETLLPVLARMMGEQLPHLQNVAAMLDAWAPDNADADIPRALGMAQFTVEGVTAQRAAIPFGLWMLQRPREFLESLSGDEHRECEAMLDDIGGAALLNFQQATHLEFSNYILQVA